MFQILERDDSAYNELSNTPAVSGQLAEVLITSISAVKRGNSTITQNSIKKDEAASCRLRSFFFCQMI